jgi:hypothetical protein
MVVHCPYCPEWIDRDPNVVKSMLRTHIENKHPEKIVG